MKSKLGNHEKLLKNLAAPGLKGEQRKYLGLWNPTASAFAVHRIYLWKDLSSFHMIKYERLPQVYHPMQVERIPFIE